MPATNSNNRATNSYNKNKKTFNKKNSTSNNSDQNEENKIIGEYLNDTVSNNAVKNALRDYLYGRGNEKEITPKELFEISQMMHMVTNCRQNNNNGVLTRDQIEMIANIFDEKPDVITKISGCYVEVTYKNNKWTVDDNDWKQIGFDMLTLLNSTTDKSLNAKNSSRAILNLLLSTADYTDGFTKIYDNLNKVQSNLNQLNDIDPKKYQDELIKASTNKNEYILLKTKIDKLEKNNQLENTINNFCNESTLIDTKNTKTNNTQVKQNLVRARKAILRMNIIPKIETKFPEKQIHSEKINKGAFDIFNNKFLYSNYDEAELAKELREKISKKIAGVTKPVVEEKISKADTNQVYGLDLTTDKKHQINKKAVEYGYECANTDKNIQESEGKINENYKSIQQQDKEYDEKFNKLKEEYKQETGSDFNDKPSSQDEIIKYMQELAIKGKITELQEYSNIHKDLNELKEKYKQEITQLSPNILKEQQNIQEHIISLTNLSKGYCEGKALEHQNDRLKKLKEEKDKKKEIINKQINDILKKMEPRTIPDISIFIQYADIQKDIKQLTQNIDKFKRADKEKFITNNETVKEYHNKLTKKYESLTKQSQELNNKMNTYNLDTTEISKLQNDIKNFNKATPSISKETTELSEQATKFNKENEKLKEELDAKIKNIKKRIDEWNSKNKKFNDLSSKLQEFTKNNTLIQEINKKYNEAKEINDSIKKLNVDQIKEDDLKAIKDILRIYENINAQKFKYVGYFSHQELDDYKLNMTQYKEADDNLSKLKQSITLNNFDLNEIKFDINKRNRYYDEIKKTKEKADKYDDANTKLEDELKPQWDEIDKLIKNIKGDKSGEIQNIITKLKEQKEKEKKEADKINREIIVPEKDDVELKKIKKLEEIKGILEKLEKTNFIDVANDSKRINKGNTTNVQYLTNIADIKKIQGEQNQLKKDLTQQKNKETINKLNKKLEEIKKDIEKNYNTAQSYNKENNETLETIKKEIDNLKKEYTDYPSLISGFNNTINRIEYRKKQADVNNDKIKTQDIKLADTIDFDIIKELDETLTRINNGAKFKSVNSDRKYDGENTKSKYDKSKKDYDDNNKNYNNIINNINNITTGNQDEIDNQAKEYNKEEEKNVKNINEYASIAQTYIKYNEDIYKKAEDELNKLLTNETYKNFKNIIEDTIKEIKERNNKAYAENNQLTKVEEKIIDTKDIKEFKKLNEKLTEINNGAQFKSVNSDEKENEDNTNTKNKYDNTKKEHDNNNKKYDDIINDINNITTNNQNDIANEAKQYNEKEKKIFNNINEYVGTAQSYIKDNEDIYKKAIEELNSLLVNENRKMFKNIIEDTQKNIEERKDIANTENNKLTKVEEKIIDTTNIEKFKELNETLMGIQERAQFESVENDGKGKKSNTKDEYLNICKEHSKLKEEYESKFKEIKIESEEDKNQLNNENNKYIEQENEIIKNVKKNVAIATQYIKNNETENDKINKEIEKLLTKYENNNFKQLIQNTKNTINKNFDTAQKANKTIEPITQHVAGELEALKEFDELYKKLKEIQNEVKFESVNNDKKEGQEYSTQNHFLSNKEMYEKNQKKHKELNNQKGKLSNMSEDDRNKLSNEIDEYKKTHKNVIENINNCKEIAGTYIENNDKKYTQIKEKIESLKKIYKNNTAIIDKTLETIRLSKEQAQTENEQIKGDFSELVINKKEFEEIKEKEQKYQTSIYIKACNVNETIDNNIKTTIKNDIKLSATMLNSYSIMKKFMNSRDKSIDKKSINEIIGGIFAEKAQEYNNNKNANEKIPTNIMDDKLSYVALLATKDPYNNIKYNIAFSGFPPEKVELFIIRNDLGNRKFKVTYDYNNNNEYTRKIDPDLTKDGDESNKKLFYAFADSLPTPEEYGKMREEALTNYNKNKEKLEKESPLRVIKTYPDNYINKQTPATATAKQQSVMSTAINKIPSM